VAVEEHRPAAAHSPCAACRVELVSFSMRAVNALLTAVGFAATFAVLFFASAMMTASLHRALTTISLVPIGG